MREAEEEGTPQKATKGWSAVVKVVLLMGLIPVVMGLPYALRVIGRVAERHRAALPTLWVGYLTVTALAVFKWNRKTMTWDSFLTHNAVHVIFSLGAYHMLSIAQMVPLEMRRMCLWLWVSVTMAVSVSLLVMDTTDYQSKAKEEEEKARKKEEKRKLRLAEREARKKPDKKPQPIWKTNKTLKRVLDIVVYALVLALAAWAALALVNYSKAFKERQQAKNWGYESTTGDDYKPHDVEDYELRETKTRMRETAADKDQANPSAGKDADAKKDPFDIRPEDL